MNIKKTNWQRIKESKDKKICHVIMPLELAERLNAVAAQKEMSRVRAVNVAIGEYVERELARM